MSIHYNFVSGILLVNPVVKRLRHAFQFQLHIRSLLCPITCRGGLIYVKYTSSDKVKHSEEQMIALILCTTTE